LRIATSKVCATTSPLDLLPHPVPIDCNRCGGITYKFCARVEMMSSVAD
jgi:hypothetical protein